MSERILTPLEEIAAENERLYQEFRDVKTAEGVFHRLTHEFSPGKLSLMLVAETGSGVEYDDIVLASGQVIGNLMISLAGSTQDPRGAMCDVWATINDHVGRVMSGLHQVNAALVCDGHESELTIEGLFRDRGGSDA